MRTLTTNSSVDGSWKPLVFRAYGTRCVYCGAPATDVDHLTPVSEGGSNALSNLRPACAACNRSVWGE